MPSSASLFIYITAPGKLPASRQAKHQTQSHDNEEDALCGMDEDREPVAAIAFGGVCQEPARKDVPWQAPGLMQVIQPEENAIHDPISFAKLSIHFWQEQSVEQEFFAEERIENGENYLKGEQVPCADPARPQLRGDKAAPL